MLDRGFFVSDCITFLASICKARVDLTKCSLLFASPLLAVVIVVS